MKQKFFNRVLLQTESGFFIYWWIETDTSDCSETEQKCWQNEQSTKISTVLKKILILKIPIALIKRHYDLKLNICQQWEYRWLWVSVPSPLLLELAAESETQESRFDGRVVPPTTTRSEFSDPPRFSWFRIRLQTITDPSASRTIGITRSSPEDLKNKFL